MKVLLKVLLVALVYLSACTTTRETSQFESEKVQEFKVERPIPYPVDLPPQFMNAVNNGTRTLTGEPGENYWVQRADYMIDAEIIPEDTLVTGSVQITYHNNSPNELGFLFLELAQNLHAKGVVRNEEVEVTGGFNIHTVTSNGDTLTQRSRLSPGEPAYGIEGTTMLIVLNEPIPSMETGTVSIRYSFKIPKRGASARMGYNKDNLYHLAYWYPRVSVLDDVNGWFTDNFTGNAEFYHDHGNYQVTFTAPEQWIVMGTGELTNANETLSELIYDRYLNAGTSDTPVKIVTKNDFGNITHQTETGTITWNFTAENVRDVAYSFVRESNWDGMRTPVGDIDNDGKTDYSRINAFWRETAPLWNKSAEYAAHSISYLSEYTGFSYPWPHMTTVEADGIIGGGMEFPMITIIGSYNNAGARALYDVTAHELAHMWIPMIVSTNERRHAWMDEGSTTFHEAQARWDYFPGSYNLTQEFYGYLRIAGSPAEGEIMRWSDYHYPGPAYGVASYPKPGSVLIALEGLLGKETFHKAWQTYIDRWAYKHPTPYDMFNTFEDVSGEDLDWFWRSWYFETWTLDQSVSDVKTIDGIGKITIEDLGRIPMPVDVFIKFEDGTSEEIRIPVDEWLKGKTSITIKVAASSPIILVEIDRTGYFPDADRSNNKWEK